MPFQLVFEGGFVLDLNHAMMVRELGAPVQWHFVADLGSDSTHSRALEADLGKLLVTGPVTVKALRQPGGIAVCPMAKVVSVNRPGLINGHGSTDRLDIIAQPTAATGSGISPFLPRRRVHKAKNMLELFDRFQHIAKPIRRVRTKLQGKEFQFPDGDKTSIIQDGISDWLFFGIILDQCRILSPKANWLPLTMVGGADQNAGTFGKWIVTPGIKAPYVEWNEVGPRQISFGPDDGEERFQFGQIESLCRVPEFPSAQFPTFGIWRPSRTFEPSRWQNWSNLDMPRFTPQGSMIWRIQDRISRSPQDNMGWETVVFAGPPETQVAGPIQQSRLSPWIGLGKVEKRDNKGPWIKVSLTGFEDGANLADVRLSTPFSGKDGKKGLHYVPEEKTDLQVSWSGRFDDSLIFNGNTRQGSADFDSPSVFLQDTHTAQYEDVKVKRIGQVTVDSNLALDVKQGTKVNSQQPLKVHADGADLKMNGGVVYTGRGL
jgi:hypothetical protein